MADIKLSFKRSAGKLIKCPDIITAGTVGLTAEFEFDSAWDGLVKNAVFEGSGTSKVVLGIEEGRDERVPHETTAVAGTTLLIGVEGRKGDGTLVIQSAMVMIKILKRGADDNCPESDPPTPTVAEQLWEAIEGKADSDHNHDTRYALLSAIADMATKAWVNAQGFITSLAGYATQAWVEAKGYLTEHQSLTEYRKSADQDIIDAGKQGTIADLQTIRSGAAAGASAYQKPAAGIPGTDLSDEVQESLDKADTALQEHQDISGLATKEELSEHTEDTDIHTTAAEKQAFQSLYPSTPPSVVGKILKVLSVNQDGTFTCEWADEQDLSDYVKNTDYATSSVAGVIRPNSTNAFTDVSNGILVATSKTQAQYEAASNSVFVGKGTLENAKFDLTKRALTDSAQTAWTSSEQLAACARMGAQKDFRFLGKLTVDTEADGVGLASDTDGNPFACTEFFVVASVKKGSDQSNCYFACALNTLDPGYNVGNNIIKATNGTNAPMTIALYIFRKNGHWSCVGVGSKNSDGNIALADINVMGGVSFRGASVVRSNEWSTVSAISFCGNQNLGSGTEIEIYGR